MRKMTRKIGPRSVGALGLTALACAGLAAAAFAGVVEYDTKLTGGHREAFFYHGKVKSAFDKCVVGRRVVLFKARPGADRRVGTDLSDRQGSSRGWWQITPRRNGRKIAYGPGRFYAKVMRKQNLVDGYVCRADREPNRGTYPRYRFARGGRL